MLFTFSASHQMQRGCVGSYFQHSRNTDTRENALIAMVSVHTTVLLRYALETVLNVVLFFSAAGSNVTHHNTAGMVRTVLKCNA